jgi:hypothetical protein
LYGIGGVEVLGDKDKEEGGDKDIEGDVSSWERKGIGMGMADGGVFEAPGEEDKGDEDKVSLETDLGIPFS